jgi:peptide/nickel transport system permease protein
VIHIAKRAAGAIVLVWAVASSAFLLTAMAPGDAASLGLPFGAPPEAIAAARAEAGLDRPLGVRYARWLGGALTGDLGASVLYRQAVAPLVVERAANTAILAIAALLVAVALGIPPALFAARRPSSVFARAVRAVSLVLLSVPPFVGALVLVVIAARTGWFPLGGMTSSADLTGLAWLKDLLWHLPVPALALALPLAATFERQQAAALADALALPAVQNARAKGASPTRVVYAHAWRLSLTPVAALGGLALAALLGGAFVVETIAAWPGLGRLTYDALHARDMGLVAGCAVAGATMLALGIFLSDVLVAWLDPRVSNQPDPT